ncbi:MAG: hypothetical protein MUW56_13845 [Chryseobacterium sp.]|uniref:hypothetical protein n=1 Tax=Chryseobacterium sp. TaxID=1871047 RepID=UPI0025BE55D1|nr:hypothetical protein [Chryseobacterium sp.]MCJ7934670.1 hypothetical protein [Chryseobacterium sp.]
MRDFLTFLFISLGVFINAQNLEKNAEIRQEGIELYRSEMASWYGTDVFKENYTQSENVGGYFSYINERVPTCIFFSKKNKVIATISFPANYNPKDAKKDFTERDFTPLEKDYFSIRQNALKRVQNDTIFKNYKDANLNFVPIIRNTMKKVYVLSGPSIDNIVIFGNDYLLTFNDKNEVKNVEKLHKGMIVQKIIDEDGPAVGGAHSHVLENWQEITPTDICTLMLYQRFTNWDQYTVVSKDYISFWDCKSNDLTIIKSEDYEKMTAKEKK